MGSAVKISEELVESARVESGVSSRSMTQQIEYWARIGRALERSPSVTMARVHAALRGELDYDALGADERAAALGRIESLVFDPKGDASLGRELGRQGRSYTAMNASGDLVTVAPGGRRQAVAPRPRRLAAKRVRRKRS